MDKKVITTTLNLINKNRPCEDGHEKLLNFLGKDYDPGKPINLLTILESNGTSDCLWAFRATTEDHRNIFGLIAADCAESVLHIYENLVPGCTKPREAIAAARALAKGKISREQASVAAKAAAQASIDTAYYAAKAVADAAAFAVDAVVCVADADAAKAAADAAAYNDYDAADLSASFADLSASFFASRLVRQKNQAEIIRKYLTF